MNRDYNQFGVEPRPLSEQEMMQVRRGEPVNQSPEVPCDPSHINTLGVTNEYLRMAHEQIDLIESMFRDGCRLVCEKDCNADPKSIGIDELTGMNRNMAEGLYNRLRKLQERL